MFWKKQAKMRDLIGSGAITVLISHLISQVRYLCNKGSSTLQSHQIEFGMIWGFLTVTSNFGTEYENYEQRFTRW